MKGRRLTTLGFFLVACLVATGFAAARVQPSGNAPTRTLAASDCQLKSAKGNIKHVIYIVFDNVHFERDNPNVPSDLEQMPHLLNFIRSNGTMMTNNHTVLISHTANGILTSLTGMYSDRHGQSVSNSFRYFKSDGSTALVLLVQVLDRPDRRRQHAADRPDTGHGERGQRLAQEHTGAMGAVHPRQL